MGCRSRSGLGKRYPREVETGEIWKLGRMAPKDCPPGQVPDMKGTQSLKGNHSGKRLRNSDHIEDSPQNELPETNKNLTQ